MSATATHSTDLQWQILRRGGKFYQLRNKIRLSSDPFNNNGTYTKRASGFINSKAAVVRVKREKQLYVTVKDGSNLNMPRKTFKKTEFAADAKPSAVAKAVSAVRPDLADVAFRRSLRLAKGLKRLTKVKAARKALSQGRKKTFKRTAKRSKKVAKK